MAEAPPPVVVVATEETARAWARAIGGLGLPARACPHARASAPADPLAAAEALARGDHDLVLATSANAVRFLPPGAGRGRPAAAVGGATARALEAAGFLVEHRGVEGAEALARRLAAALPPRRVLWLRGARAREEGARALRAAGWVVEEVVAYRTVPVAPFASSVRAPVRAWVVGSPAAVDALASALGPAGFPPRHGTPVVAVGSTTLRALLDRGVVGAARAAAPSADAVARAVLDALRA